MAKTHDFLYVYNNKTSIKTDANFYMNSAKVGPMDFGTGSFPAITSGTKNYPVHCVYDSGKWKWYAELQGESGSGSGFPAGSITIHTACFDEVVCLYDSGASYDFKFIFSNLFPEPWKSNNWALQRDGAVWSPYLFHFPVSATTVKPIGARHATVARRPYCQCPKGTPIPGVIWHNHCWGELSFTFWLCDPTYHGTRGAPWRTDYSFYPHPYDFPLQYYAYRAVVHMMKSSLPLDEVEGEWEVWMPSFANDQWGIDCFQSGITYYGADLVRRSEIDIYNDWLASGTDTNYPSPGGYGYRYLDELMAVQLQPYPSYKITITRN